MKVLVINSGSSSLKAQLINSETGEVYAKCGCERIGLDKAFMRYTTDSKSTIEHDMPTHREAFQLVLDTLLDEKIGVVKDLSEIGAVGHRLVNLGEKFSTSYVITEEKLKEMEECIHFAPIHNPPAILVIKTCMDVMPNIKNVAVVDTAFHTTMPAKAYRYAIPADLYTDHKIRRYGAHGTSHRYIAMQCEKMLGDLTGKKIISCHIGSGSSICAIQDGKCVDTSMGYTPLAGVVMGTRSGDVDPSVVKAIMEVKNCSVDKAIDLLNKGSGLVGLTGFSDMRDIDANLDNPDVKLALDMMVYSIKKYIGAYVAAMNGVDYLVFTAGVGENDEIVRREVCKDMDYLGIKLDVEKNDTLARGTTEEIGAKDSRVRIFRIPTDEEFMIAMDTANLAK